MTWLLALAFLAAGHPTKRVVVTTTEIEVYDPIAFPLGSDRLPAGCDKALAAIATTLDGNPSLRVVAVQADVTPRDGGNARARNALGLRRAAVVRARLIALGVAPQRLTVQVTAGDKPVIEMVVIERAEQP